MKAFRLIYHKLMYPVMYFINHIKGINHKKFFFSGMGMGYNDNARAVSECLHEKMPDAKIVWLLSSYKKNDTHIPPYVSPINNRLSTIYHLATSCAWVYCGPISNTVYKSKKQKYVHLWHGDRGFKKILKDCYADPRERFLFETDNCDLMVSGSSFFNRVIESAFGYKGRILQKGSPRNDLLLKDDADLRLKIRKEINIPTDIKVLLYAPTFRDVSLKIDEQKENINIDSILSTLRKRFGGEWICLGRFHPVLRNKSHFSSDAIIDVTDYYDMADLLYISDALITDYSSSAGDFVLMNKPVYLYQPDIDAYIEKDRELYMKPEEIPFFKARTQEELESIILTASDTDIIANCKAVNEFYGTNETGCASEVVVDYLLDK